MIQTATLPFRVFLLLLVFVHIPCIADEVRIATYNIKYLSTSITEQDNRLQKLKEVIELLDADVIGLQEIDDRAALEIVFSPTNWTLIIDDDSGDKQDLALAVRKPLKVKGFNSDLDADDKHFLFSGSNLNSPFPKRRDLLAVEVELVDGSTFHVLVNHAKARSGGRANTDSRREDAARRIVEVLQRDFDEQDFVLLGDFNDNPDDKSLNILETGNAAAPGGMENIPGPFLVNLTESLLVEGHVSHGLNSANIVGDRINTIDTKSRQRNNDARGTNANTGDILFDQILIPGWMLSSYIDDSVAVFDYAIALRGNKMTRASDHLPVYADFILGGNIMPDQPSGDVLIASALPNPYGDDAGNEAITVVNYTQESIDLSGWVLRDKANNKFTLSGIVAPGESVRIVMTTASMPLNNSGDEIQLIDENGVEHDRVFYSATDAEAGEVVKFH